MTDSGAPSGSGITTVVVGTGGRSLYGITPITNSVARSAAGFGWLQLTLGQGSADLRFVPVGGHTFSDRHTITCR